MDAGLLSPDPERLPASGPIAGGTDEMTAGPEVQVTASIYLIQINA
jgi:hypothetical protein